MTIELESTSCAARVYMSPRCGWPLFWWSDSHFFTWLKKSRSSVGGSGLARPLLYPPPDATPFRHSAWWMTAAKYLAFVAKSLVGTFLGMSMC